MWSPQRPPRMPEASTRIASGTCYEHTSAAVAVACTRTRAPLCLRLLHLHGAHVHVLAHDLTMLAAASACGICPCSPAAHALNEPLLTGAWRPAPCRMRSAPVAHCSRLLSTEPSTCVRFHGTRLVRLVAPTLATCGQQTATPVRRLHQGHSGMLVCSRCKVLLRMRGADSPPDSAVPFSRLLREHRMTQNHTSRLGPAARCNSASAVGAPSIGCDLRLSHREYAVLLAAPQWQTCQSVLFARLVLLCLPPMPHAYA